MIESGKHTKFRQVRKLNHHIARRETAHIIATSATKTHRDFKLTIPVLRAPQGTVVAED